MTASNTETRGLEIALFQAIITTNNANQSGIGTGDVNSIIEAINGLSPTSSTVESLTATFDSLAGNKPLNRDTLNGFQELLQTVQEGMPGDSNGLKICEALNNVFNARLEQIPVPQSSKWLDFFERSSSSQLLTQERLIDLDESGLQEAPFDVDLTDLLDVDLTDLLDEKNKPQITAPLAVNVDTTDLLADETGLLDTKKSLVTDVEYEYEDDLPAKKTFSHEYYTLPIFTGVLSAGLIVNDALGGIDMEVPAFGLSSAEVSYSIATLLGLIALGAIGLVIYDLWAQAQEQAQAQENQNLSADDEFPRDDTMTDLPDGVPLSQSEFALQNSAFGKLITEQEAYDRFSEMYDKGKNDDELSTPRP